MCCRSARPVPAVATAITEVSPAAAGSLWIGMSQAADAKDEPVTQRDAESPASPVVARAEEGTAAKGEPATLTGADLSSVPPAASGASLFGAGLLFSALLHAGVLIYLQSERTDDVGPGGVQLEVINVDLVPESELRIGASTPSPGVGNDTYDQDEKDRAEAARRKVTETPPPEGLIKPTDGTSELAAADVMKPDPIHEHREEKADEEKLEKSEEPDIAHDDRGYAKQAQEAVERKERSGSSVTVTPGQISLYALSIQQTLNVNRPHHVGTRGRAVVKFNLSDTGRVQFAAIQKSSGSKLIDDAVLAAISRIRFPIPPGGMTERQRSFMAPVEFR